MHACCLTHGVHPVLLLFCAVSTEVVGAGAGVLSLQTEAQAPITICLFLLHFTKDLRGYGEEREKEGTDGFSVMQEKKLKRYIPYLTSKTTKHALHTIS